MKTLLKSYITVGLILTMLACSTSWLTQAQAIVNVIVPSTTNFIILVTVLENKTITPADVAVITNAANEANKDFALIGSLLQQYAATPSASQPAILEKIQAALRVAEQNFAGILPAIHISDPATLSKVEAVVGVVLSEITSIEALLPIIKPGMNRLPSKAPMNAAQFKTLFNSVMKAKTGNSVIDQTTAKLSVR